jgi:GNAT superfamily N-acetyltransferase
MKNSNLCKQTLTSANQSKMDIQTLGHKDVELLGDLQPLGWEDILPFYNFYTNAAFCFPIKVIIDQKIVGIGTTIIHHDIAWLGHIIVHPDFRNKGIGSGITQQLVDSLQTRHCNTIYLIATDLGAPVYEKLGFETDTEYLFFKDIKVEQSLKISEHIIPYLDEFKEKIANIDRRVSGENRMFRIEQHLETGYVYHKDNVIEGYYLPTFGEGLIIADTSSAGIELMRLRLSKNGTACFPANNLSALDYLYQLNYKEYKIAKRMRLGMKRSWHPENIYNRIGGNIG